jgi:signal transduction histidine kinase
MTEDTHGRVWIITAGGTGYWKNGMFTRLTSQQFPYEHLRVTTLHEDGSGHLWFGTWFGVIEWSDSVLARYDTRDGLAADFVNAIGEDSSGNLWFATSGGLTKLPKSVRVSAIPLPALSINRISDEGEMKILTGSTRLPYDERTVNFQISSMSYYDERNMEFQYMLHGIERDWNPPTKQRIVRYTTLPPGSYSLRVRGRNRNGAWTEAGAYPFEILPPYWATWWFRFSAVSAIAGFLFALYRYRVSKLLELERLRLRIATDLHDEIGSFLGSIALESEITQRKLQVSEEVKQRLAKIAALSRRTAEAMRDIVWVISPEHDSMETLEVKMKEVAAQMLKGIPHSVVVSSETPTEILDLDFKRNLYLVYKEALHNILKHAHATRVDIIVEQKKKRMRLKIADNGVGFDEQAVVHGNGLKNIRTRAAKMEADLSLSSVSGSGTTIELSSNIP